jgi:hypothetical protein
LSQAGDNAAQASDDEFDSDEYFDEEPPIAPTHQAAEGASATTGHFSAPAAAFPSAQSSFALSANPAAGAAAARAAAAAEEVLALDVPRWAEAVRVASSAAEVGRCVGALEDAIPPAWLSHW